MNKWAYYNDSDKYCCEWARNLMKAGLVLQGEVDSRPIQEVQPEDVQGFVQCHFFSGMLGWPYALGLAGWSPDEPIWTGSCPCQPFSVAGKRKGAADERHLWPHFFRLIRACRPAVVMGEQVAGAAGYAWLDGVRSDLEGEGYSCRAVDIPACAVNAPHRRNRLYWVAESSVKPEHQQENTFLPGGDRWATWPDAGRGGARSDGLADSEDPERRPEHKEYRDTYGRLGSRGRGSGLRMADRLSPRLARPESERGDDGEERPPAERSGGDGGGMDDTASARHVSRQSGEGGEARDGTWGPEPERRGGAIGGVGNSESGDEQRDTMSGTHREGQPAGGSGGGTDGVEDPTGPIGWQAQPAGHYIAGQETGWQESDGGSTGRSRDGSGGESGRVEDSHDEGSPPSQQVESHPQYPNSSIGASSGRSGFWDSWELAGPDPQGKFRRVGRTQSQFRGVVDDGRSLAGDHGLRPIGLLTKGEAQRVNKLRCLGNSIVIPLAAEVIRAWMETRP